MKNTFGTSIAVTLFGESHGAYIGAVLDGLAPGIGIDEAYIASQLSKRRPAGKISTARHEQDRFEIVSGVYNGRTTGTPLTILIRNEDTKSKDYAATRALARPGHADYTANIKYHGFEDYRGGGHFSGRITAALVAAGAIVLSALEKKGIVIGTHIRALGKITDRDFADVAEDIKSLNAMDFAALDEEKAQQMRSEIEKAAKDGDSVGGVLETAILGTPAGVGEPWFDTVEGILSHALFSIPAVKGVEFGRAFENSMLRGSAYNDSFYISDKEIRTTTNHNGGVNGGITNAMPILFSCTVKPTPSIYKEQNTVDFLEKKNAVLSLKGRHDPCILHRARVVVDSVAALCIADLLAQRYGTDWLADNEELETKKTT